jgi:hypothetical protein
MRAKWLVAAILIMQIVEAPAWAASTKVQGAHSMTGTITMIDHSTGALADSYGLLRAFHDKDFK